MSLKTILILNGPNLGSLHLRDPDVYGGESLRDIQKECEKNFPALSQIWLHSNHEGQLIDWMEQHRELTDALIINAGAYTHTSYALRDAVEVYKKPAVEVHLSNIYKRESFRHKSVIAPVCKGQIAGFGGMGYALALTFLEASIAQTSGCGVRRDF